MVDPGGGAGQGRIGVTRVGGTLRALLWLRTARSLPPAQAAAWLRHRLTPARPTSLDVTVSATRSVAWPALTELAGEIDAAERRSGRETADLAVDHRYRFSDREVHLPRIDWSKDYESPLWTYQLHYLGHALDLARAWRTSGEDAYGERYVEIWDDWLGAAARGQARIEPYPASVRCMNALRSLWLVEDRLPDDFATRLLAGTKAQLAWLCDNVERHLRANHLQKNLTALAWGSLAFAEPPGNAASMREELWRELDEQVLPDGGHYERSPMYHAAALDDFLRTYALCRAAETTIPEFAAGRLVAMTRALQWLSRPDGTLHLFNDAVDGEEPGRATVLSLAARVLEAPSEEPAGAFALEDTGYYGHVDPDGGHRLVIDAGPPGPSYQPGHAHCDMLSFELDAGGRPVVVDSGLHGYDGDPYREYVRSTRAHNTVAIDGKEQHEVWATFRVARRGAIRSAAAGAVADGGFEFRGSASSHHDRSAVHHRTVALRRGELRVVDRVEGGAGRGLAGWLHVHPELHLRPTANGFVAIYGSDKSGPDINVAIDVFGADETRVVTGELDPVQGWYCERFGQAIPAPVIEMRIERNDGREFGYTLRWSEE